MVIWCEGGLVSLGWWKGIGYGHVWWWKAREEEDKKEKKKKKIKGVQTSKAKEIITKSLDSMFNGFSFQKTKNKTKVTD